MPIARQSLARYRGVKTLLMLATGWDFDGAALPHIIAELSPPLVFYHVESSLGEPRMNFMTNKQVGAPRRQAVSSVATEVAAQGRMDSIKSLSGSIRHLRAKSADGLVLHVVSTTSGEGTTTIAHGLAAATISNANMSVLLLDDSDDELKQIAWSSQPASQPVSIARSYAMSALEQPGTATGMAVGEPRLQTEPAHEITGLYQRYRSKFDITIIDCPAIASGRYLELMPNAADGIILVVEAEKVRPVVVSRAKQSIEEHGGQVLGVVLNKARRYIPQFIYRFM